MNFTKLEMQLRFHPEQDFLLLKTIGPINKKSLVELITKSVSEADNNNCRRILFDHRGSQLDLSYIELHLIISNLKKYGLTSDYRCIVVYDVDVEKYRFSDTVIHNWCGWIVRFYDNYEEGLEWLLK